MLKFGILFNKIFMIDQKNIGLFFGTFNPPHIGHTLIANYFYITNDFDEIWLIVSPQNPFKKNSNLLDANLRLKMVELAIEDAHFLKASDVEFDLPKPSYTYKTLETLTTRFPHYNFSIIIGSDNAVSLDKWENYQYLIDNFTIYVYPRNGFLSSNIFKHKNIFIDSNAPYIDICSKWIREQLSQNKDLRFFLRKSVYDFIIENKLYVS